MSGCAHQPVNPSFPVTANVAETQWQEMADHPKPLARPLVVIGGLMDPGVSATWLTWQFDSISTNSRIIAVALGDCFSMEDCRRKIVGAVNRELPQARRDQTVPVDVLGYSLGGLAARYAADPTLPGCRLCIERLFTISAPLRGASQAQRMPVLHPLQAEMRPGSRVVQHLNAMQASYTLVPYVRLGDDAVGEQNAALPGHVAWWVSDPPLSDPHMGAFADRRILADIARRLRGEKPLTTTPPAQLPAE